MQLIQTYSFEVHYYSFVFDSFTVVLLSRQGFSVCLTFVTCFGRAFVSEVSQDGMCDTSCHLMLWRRDQHPLHQLTTPPKHVKEVRNWKPLSWRKQNEMNANSVYSQCNQTWRDAPRPKSIHHPAELRSRRIQGLTNQLQVFFFVFVFFVIGSSGQLLMWATFEAENTGACLN